MGACIKKTHTHQIDGWLVKSAPWSVLGLKFHPYDLIWIFFFSLLRFESPPKVLLQVSRVIWNRSGLSVLGLPQRVSQPHGRLNRSAPPPGEPQLANRKSHPAERERERLTQSEGQTLEFPFMSKEPTLRSQKEAWNRAKVLLWMHNTLDWFKNVDGRILRSPVTVLKS